MDNTESLWLSTYGLLTAQRILERYHLSLEQDELLASLSNPLSIYAQLVRLPLKNIFNGLIRQQAHDYQVYAQKLFIDYLMSGQGNKEPDSPGANTRSDLENERTQLTDMGAGFNDQEFEQESLISESQVVCMKHAEAWRQSMQTVYQKITELLKKEKAEVDPLVVQKAIRMTLCQDMLMSPVHWDTFCDTIHLDRSKEIPSAIKKAVLAVSETREAIADVLLPYLERATDLGVMFRGYHTQFHDLILRVTELIKLLPDYQIDDQKEDEGLRSLDFDVGIVNTNPV